MLTFLLLSLSTISRVIDAMVNNINTNYNTTICPTAQADGAVIVKTKQAILVAEYAAPIQAGQATPIVENLADYLINVGY